VKVWSANLTLPEPFNPMSLFYDTTVFSTFIRKNQKNRLIADA